jgi:signal transduction histidine kinase
VLDAIRIGQVLTNLLDNAIKFSPNGGTIDLTIDQPEPTTWRLNVRDHGAGIPPERMPRIFERHYQAHGEAHAGGMGLGLYVSRQIVELHGGTIAAHCPPDGGTCFTVTLPATLPVTPHSPGVPAPAPSLRDQ